MKPQRRGPLPTLESATDALIVPDQAAPVYQARMVRMLNQLKDCLNQIDNRPPGHTFRYNAKIDAHAAIFRNPDGAHWAVHADHMTRCTTLSDWQGLARRMTATLRDEAEAVREEQDKSRLYDTIQRVMRARSRRGATLHTGQPVEVPAN
jgi:hypothetical protein